MAEFTASYTLFGDYHWEPFFNIDNTTNSAPITKEEEVENYVDSSNQAIFRAILRPSDSDQYVSQLVRQGFGILDLECISDGGEEDPSKGEVKAKYNEILKNRTEHRFEDVKIESYEIGAHSSLRLNRLVFRGPGLSYTTNIISKNREEIPYIVIKFKGRLLPVLKGIEVVIRRDSDQRPEDMIGEARGLSADVNLGRGGPSVWLRPIWTYDLSQGVNGVQLVVRSEEDDGYENYAPGREGEFRYLMMIRDPETTYRITEIALWRRLAGSEESELPHGSNRYRFRSENFNGGREGEDDLFLVWNVREIN